MRQAYLIIFFEAIVDPRKEEDERKLRELELQAQKELQDRRRRVSVYTPYVFPLLFLAFYYFLFRNQ